MTKRKNENVAQDIVVKNRKFDIGDEFAIAIAEKDTTKLYELCQTYGANVAIANVWTLQHFLYIDLFSYELSPLLFALRLPNIDTNIVDQLLHFGGNLFIKTKGFAGLREIGMNVLVSPLERCQEIMPIEHLIVEQRKDFFTRQKKIVFDLCILPDVIFDIVGLFLSLKI